MASPVSHDCDLDFDRRRMVVMVMVDGEKVKPSRADKDEADHSFRYAEPNTCFLQSVATVPFEAQCGSRERVSPIDHAEVDS